MGRSRVLGVAVFLILASHVQPTLALEGFPDHFCRNGMFGWLLDRAPELKLGRVVGAGKAFLRSDSQSGCPQAGARCRTSRSLDPGALVAILPSPLKDYVCVLTPADGEAGWLASRRTRTIPTDRSPLLEAWGGTWRMPGDNTIVLRPRKDGQLQVAGRAYWPGRGIYPEHTGELSGLSRPEGNHVFFGSKDEPGQCQARLTLLGHGVLAASENRWCGGANVDFGGVYRRIR